MMKPEDYIARLNRLRSGRAVLDSHLQEVADRICPRRGTFLRLRPQGGKNMQYVYDSTPIHANELLAAGLNGMLTNPSTEWFGLRTVEPALNSDREVKEWLEEVERIMMAAINSPFAGFSTAVHEMYIEFGAFGTGCIFITENTKRGGLLFQARPLSEMYLAESPEGIIDTVYRIFRFTVRQMVRTWGELGVGEKVRRMWNEGKYDDEVQILHAVQPRADFDPGKRDSSNLPVASVYLEAESGHLLGKGGFHEMPYIVPRFYKAPGETYGRGPGMTALADVKQLNEMAKTTIKAAQKIVDPPLMAPDKGFLNPVKTQPGGLNFYIKDENPRRTGYDCNSKYVKGFI